MLDASLPPYDADAAMRMGDNSRAAQISPSRRRSEIRRTAEEIRSAYLKNNLHENTSTKWRVLHVANISNMSDAAFRQLFTYISFGNRNCDNITASNHTVGVILQKGERAVQRANKELEDAGWLTDANHRGPKEPGRTADIPPKAIPDRTLNAIVFELVGASHSTPLKPIEVPNLTPLSKTTPPSNETDPCQTRRATPVKDDDRTYIENLGNDSWVAAREKADPDNLEEQDAKDFLRLALSWGSRPDDLRPWMDIGTARGTLRQTANAHAQQPKRLVIQAIRATICALQQKAIAGDHGKHGRSGFGQYFVSAVDGNVRFLLRQETEPRAAAPPSQQPWQSRLDREEANRAKNDEIFRQMRERAAKR